MDTSLKEEIAMDLLRIGAIFLRPDEPFTWSSGIKSPIYCDNRLILSHPDVRLKVGNAIAETVRTQFSDCEGLMGTSTAGIPHATIAAHLLELPMGYVRIGAKDHGRKKQIDGKLSSGQKVVVIEDLISTAGSALSVVEVLRNAGADVLGIVSIFTYGMKIAKQNLHSANVEHRSLSDFDTLIDVAIRQGVIREEQKGQLLQFRANPSDHSWSKEGRCICGI